MEFFRRNRLLSFFLLSLLCLILVGKVIWPMYSKAQTTPGSSSNSNTSSSAGPDTSCSQSGINILDYVAPGGPGNQPPSIHASVIQTDGQTHIGDVINRVNWYDTNNFAQNAGSGSVIYQKATNNIKLNQNKL